MLLCHTVAAKAALATVPQITCQSLVQLLLAIVGF
jgi:hypothetical protein